MNNKDRRQEALNVRVTAAELAAHRRHPRHTANGDEQKFHQAEEDPCNPQKTIFRKTYLASFTKGMPHDPETGLLADPQDFQNFVKAIDSGDPRDFMEVPLGPPEYEEDKCSGGPWKSNKAKDAKVRAWESQSAGNAFDLEGPDAQAVTMPPAPALGSPELTAEIAEVYAQALLRDVPFTTIAKGKGDVHFDCAHQGRPDTNVEDILRCLNGMRWFKDPNCCGLTAAEAGRQRGPFDGQTAFRGVTPGDDVGPYISQFMLAGNPGITGAGAPEEREPKNGYITYGAVTIDQRVRVAAPCVDYMTTWKEWLDVQHGASLLGREEYQPKPPRRFIETPRDLATYVHFDALYEAYLNACLILLADGTPFDPDIPFQAADFIDHQQGFAHFGGPHILSLVTEVATRALKAVRFQKFNIHRRLRPEALAARLARADVLDVREVDAMVGDKNLKRLLRLVEKKNGKDPDFKTEPNYLLPMAFCEGSPMHPAYGAGHATVAGACVTILKAFFDHSRPLTIAGSDDCAFVPTKGGKSLTTISVANGRLTVEGELNKLASNISIGRNWAGVHYYSDYIESLRMGEQIALGILEEQKLTYGENFSMTVPLFDGGSVRI